MWERFSNWLWKTGWEHHRLFNFGAIRIMISVGNRSPFPPPIREPFSQPVREPFTTGSRTTPTTDSSTTGEVSRATGRFRAISTDSTTAHSKPIPQDSETVSANRSGTNFFRTDSQDPRRTRFVPCNRPGTRFSAEYSVLDPFGNRHKRRYWNFFTTHNSQTVCQKRAAAWCVHLS